MCGITGVVRLDGQSVDRKTIAGMTGAITHRGPDGDGTWVDGEVGFGHRRLAVIDLTPAAAQPMFNETGDVVMVYNGELYNFQQVGVELETAGRRRR